MEPSPPAAPTGRPRLVLGLGNPGEPYRDTRHNVGFAVVEGLARRLGIPLADGDCRCRIGARGDLVLALPQTYMNRSGYAARCLAERHGLAGADCLVVYDDVNLPLGRLRLRRGGSPGGHRGLESIVESLQTDEVPRLRLGVQPEGGGVAGAGLADFVLAPFAADELPNVREMVERAEDACLAWIEDGVDAAMNRFNG